VCCIGSLEEMEMAVAHGASALGLVSNMPSGPGVIPEELIAEIALRVPPGVDSFLLSCSQDVEEIVAQHSRCKTSVIQICDRLQKGTYRNLRAALPGIRLVQVIHVAGSESVMEASNAASEADAILLDSGKPAAAIKELGGTGRIHDWNISLEIRERIAIPIFLAGGLRPDNVAGAVRRVGPFALDVCSGVRTNGRLDEEKLSQFFARARA